MVALVAGPNGKFAAMNVVEANGTAHTVAVRFDWKPDRLYLPFVYRLGPGRWGAWVYDQSADRWVAIGQLTLPPEWGKLSPTSVTMVLWYGPSGPACSSYPLADVFFYPPLGYVGSTPTLAAQDGSSWMGGDCGADIAGEYPPWIHYRVGPLS